MITTLIGALLLAFIVGDTVRLRAAAGHRSVTLARLRGRRAAAGAAERRLAHRLLAGRINATAYRREMATLARQSRAGRSRKTSSPAHHTSARPGGD